MRAMSDKGIHLVRAHLAKLPPSSTLTIAQLRAQYDRAEREADHDPPGERAYHRHG